MKPFTVNARDRGLALITRINRIMLGAAVALAGLLSVAAAKSFHGHQRRAAATVSTPAPSTSSGSTSTGSGAGNTGNTGGGLQAPAQMPSSVQQVPAPVQQAPVVSGGS
jgi:hypothetical protein